MKRLLTFLTLLTVFIGVGWANDATFAPSDFSGQGTSGTGSAISATVDGVTFACDKGYGTTQIRCYNGSTITISSSNTITGISFTFSGAYTGGLNTSYSNLSTTSWTQTLSSQARITAVTVTYTPSQAEPDPETPNGTITFTPAAGEVASGTTVSMTFSGTCDGIKYTLDGTSPSATNGTVYNSSNPPAITGATTITAAAYNYSNSKYAFGTEATASYTLEALPEVEYDGSATFVAGTDLGSTTGNNSSDEMTKAPVTVSSDDAAFGRTDNYRLYAGSTTTFSVTTGYKIVKIEFTGVGSSNPISNLSVSDGSTGTYTINGTLGTWIGDAEEVSFDASAQTRMTQIQVYYTAPASSGPEYYLAGDFNSWQQNADYKFIESNGSYVLNDVNLPDGQEFKIIKVDNGTTWYGGNGGGSHYGIHGGHHDNINIGGNDNFYIEVGGVTDFSFTVNNNTPSVLTVSRDAQLYVKGDFNNWTKEAMTLGADGWTINKDIAATNQFGFVDEWGTFYGGNGYWIYKANDMGKPISLNSNGNFYMVDAGNYDLTVNAALTTLTVTTITGDEYTLVESASDLEAGGEYIIAGGAANSPYTVLMGAVSSNGAAVTSGFIYNANAKTMTLSSDCAAQVLTLGGSTGAWTFYTGSAYLSLTSDGNNLNTSASADADNAKWTIDADEMPLSKNLIANNQYTSRYLEYNSGSPRFACYTGSQQAVALFKKAVPSNKSAMPVISPEGGNIVGLSQEVTITQENNGTIYYTTDGTTPDENSTQYNGAFFTPAIAQLGDEVTVTAVAKEDGKDLSNPVSVTYKFVAPARPTFTPAAGTYPVAQNVSMATTTEGADVYYTTNSELTKEQIVAQGTKFTAPINVSEETTFYAVAAYYDAHAEGYAISSIAQANYKFSEVESEDLDYTHTFTGGTGFGKFTTQDVNNPDEITVWTVTDDYGAKGTSFTQNPNTNHAATSWLLSPYINLGEAVEPVLTFDHQINKYFANPSTQATVWIRTYGGEWTQLTTSLPTSSTGLSGWTEYNEEYDLSAYNGQLVQVGFKYDNPTAGSGAGTWEIQNFSVAETYSAPIEVENIAEYNALPAGTKNIIFKNPVTVQYHYISSSGKSYIYVKDDTGCAYFHQPAVNGETAIAQLQNGDIIGARFSGDKEPDEMVSDEESNFFMLTNLENFAPNGDKGLADPEHETVAHIADATTGVALNNHYITIKKVKLSALYLPDGITYGGEKYFDIDNVAHIGYNKFNIDWSVVDDLDAYYNITGIQTAYNNVMEFHPTEIVKWEETVVTLRQLCDEGVTTDGENEYTISNNLMCVYANGNSIWVKDDTGQSICMTSPEDGDENFEVFAEAADGVAANTRLNQAYYDQSNWCEIKLANDNDTEASAFVGQIIKGGSIQGNFTNKLNPTLENVYLAPKDISSEGSYALNYYMPANFMGSQDCGNNSHNDYEHTYFFMNPKPQEYAQIVWAVWSSQDEKFIMSTSTSDNAHRFEGSFSISFDLNTGASSYSQLTNGYGYNFKAILRMTSSKANGYMVYPLDLDEGIDPTTSINTVNAGNGMVKSVKYVNVAGIVSDVPFQGINIVVTEYTDGTRTTTKMLKK